jgi:nitrogen-specific signal transduction histidine kinase
VSAVLSDTEEGDSMIKVDVMDNGVGIENEIREKLFSPFCTTKARGIGLGLPIARRTVMDHGGKLSVEATRKGTSIEVLLPALQPAADTTPAPQAPVVSALTALNRPIQELDRHPLSNRIDKID